ncbi:MAG TPA: trehalose-6-phosphate synthase [Candidatus Dormibacteraeota bacterium]|jgi:trehalose 6-phosphate synthase|nr:trehalose-6-phosphate synthase [Candidatus Dormibacteraeota bacterium]
MLAIEQYTRRLLRDFHPIVAANRPPVDLAPDPADRERFVRGSGGLVTGLSGLARATGAVWVASVRDGFEGELELGDGGEPMMVETTDGSRFQVSWVNPPSLAYDLYYNTIANPLLWFVQHYLWNLAEAPVLDDSTHQAWTEGYRLVNQLFAQQIVREARRGRKRPLVLSHDYHLYLVPRLVRRELPDAVLQHFVHIPWPTPQYWKVLPHYMRDEIMDGLLAADVIGLQTHSDVRNFLLTCEENMGLPVDFRQQTAFYRGRTVWVRRYPISIDVREFERSAASPAVERAERDVLRWRPEQLIYRVDRMDLSKNIIRGFIAYERLLQAHPEWHRRVVFWAMLQKTRQNVPEYREYARQVVQVVRVINSRYGSADWQPIRLELRDDMNRAVAGYKQFDVLLVNPIYDGMNLVAKEGITVNRRGGALVLSENAGTHEELGEWAITINPFDVDATAQALHSALLMDPAERHARAEKMRAVVQQNDVARWISAQLQDIRDLIEPLAARQPEPANEGTITVGREGSI